MSIKEFAFSENTVNALIKKNIFKASLYMLFVCSMTTWFMVYRNEGMLETMFIFVPFLLLVMGVTFYFSYKRLKNQLNSFVLMITDTEIIREQNNTPTIRHLKSDITEIVKHHEGSFSIKANSTKDIIVASGKLENVNELEGLLNQIQPIKINQPRQIMERFSTLITVSMLGIMGIFFVSTNVWIVEITGFLTLAILIYSLFATYNNKNVDIRTRRLMFIVVLPMFSIIGKMYYTAFPIVKKDKIENSAVEKADDELITTIEIFTEAPKEDAKNHENGLIAGIQLENIEAAIKHLYQPDSIVLPYNQATIEIDYPLDSTYIGELRTSNKGFTQKELVREITKLYHKIYAEEEATATTKTIPRNKRVEKADRNQTNGKYGIWGYDLSDLYLMKIEVYKTKQGEIVLLLVIEA